MYIYKTLVSQSVKEVVESLVADNLINCEKIGNYNLNNNCNNFS